MGTATFVLETNRGGLIDEGSYTMASGLFEPSTISAFSVEALDLTAGKYPVTYRFTVTPKSRVTQGAYFILKMPDQVTPYSSGTLNDACPR